MTPHRLLFIVREPYPTFRSDVASLFGKYLPRQGIYSDYVAEKEMEAEDIMPWGGGQALLCEGGTSPLRRQWRKLVQNIRQMAGASPSVYDAIQVRDLAITSFIALVIGRIRGLPVYFWMSFPMCDAQIQRARRSTMRDGRCFWFPMVQGLVGRSLLRCFVLKHADHVFVQSDHMRDRLVSSGVPTGKLTAVPMGADLEVLHREQAVDWNTAERNNRKVIVHLGILEASRSSEMLIDVMALVHKKIPEVELLCIGSCESPAYQALLERKIKAHGLGDAIRITGWVSQPEAWKLAGQADMGLCLIPCDPLYLGASPTKLIECLALGLPMVVNEHPEQRQVIDVSGAGYCVPWSASEIAEATIRILADTDAANEMRMRGPRYVEQHRSYDRIAAMVADRYRELLRKEPGVRH